MQVHRQSQQGRIAPSDARPVARYCPDFLTAAANSPTAVVTAMPSSRKQATDFRRPLSPESHLRSRPGNHPCEQAQRPPECVGRRGPQARHRARSRAQSARPRAQGTVARSTVARGLRQEGAVSESTLLLAEGVVAELERQGLVPLSIE